MRKVVFGCAALLLAGCGTAPATRAPHPSAGHKGARVPAPAIERILRGLSPTQLAGQRIVYAYSGLLPPASLIRLIRRGDAAGVIFFASNIASHIQLRAVIRELQRANSASPVHAPLLMMTDQEGGQVRRLSGSPAPSEKQLGESANANAEASLAGAGAGRNLRGAGLNTNLAPVLDVARETGNFIDQYERSYGPDAQKAAALGRAFIKAQQGVGVGATAKHFPGLGSASQSQNTDERAVVLNVPASELRSIDELPYRQAISAGVRMVMLSWATYPSLDPSHPAGLSSKIIRRELRTRLGFPGVTITDSLGTQALAAYGGSGRRAVLAAAAGADLILCSAAGLERNTPAIGVAALHGIAHAITDGVLSRAESQAAAARIQALRETH